MTEYKVVKDWQETGAQVQSALSPFSVERNGRHVEMLGSYATAELDGNTSLGVIAIQDEHAALSSVADMRKQTLVISLLAAAFALVIGYFLARGLTQPVRDLAEGAQGIAAGDFSGRITVSVCTELDELGHSFNQMTEQVERFIGDLQRAADENRELFIGTVKALAAAIDVHEPDVIALAGFMRILGAAFVGRYAGRLLNVHPSLLPAFAGLGTHRRVVEAGCKLSGAT